MVITPSVNTTESSATQATTKSTATVPVTEYDPTATDPDGWNNVIIKP